MRLNWLKNRLQDHNPCWQYGTWCSPGDANTLGPDLGPGSEGGEGAASDRSAEPPGPAGSPSGRGAEASPQVGGGAASDEGVLSLSLNNIENAQHCD